MCHITYISVIFNFRRQGSDAARNAIVKKTNVEKNNNPIFGKLDPMTILGLLMKNNPNSLKSKFSKLRHCTVALLSFMIDLLLDSW